MGSIVAEIADKIAANAEALEIRGGTGAAGGGILTLSTSELSTVDGDILGRIDFQAPLDGAGSDAILVPASIWAEADATFSSTVNNTELVFATATGTAAAEKMRLDSAGQLGIGVTTPASLLHVAGTVQVGVDDIGHDVKFFGATSGSYIQWDESADSLLLTDSTPIKIGDGLDMTIYHTGSNSFITNATGSLNIATLTSGIDINIGHTTSETTVNDNLTVTGTMNISNIQAPASNPIYLKDEGGTISLTISDDGYTGLSGTANLDADIRSHTVLKGALKIGVANKDTSGWVGHGYLMADYTNAGFPADGSAYLLKETTGSDGSLYLVSGQGTDGRFTDLVLYTGSATPVILHSLTQSSPTTRTYSRSGENLKLAIASGNEWGSIGWTAIGGNERTRTQGNAIGT